MPYAWSILSCCRHDDYDSGAAHAPLMVAFCASCARETVGGAVLRGGWLFCSIECAREPGASSSAWQGRLHRDSGEQVLPSQTPRSLIPARLTAPPPQRRSGRSEEHTSELQSPCN